MTSTTTRQTTPRLVRSESFSRLFTSIVRVLRIVFTVACGGLCLIIIFFWVRSYSIADSGLLKILPSEYIQVHAGDGRMCIWFEHKSVDKWFDWYSNRITIHTPPDADNRIPSFHLAFWPTFARLYTAHWLLAVVTGFLAVAPWLSVRFSVRTLLISVTVVALVAAVITWVDRSF